MNVHAMYSGRESTTSVWTDVLESRVGLLDTLNRLRSFWETFSRGFRVDGSADCIAKYEFSEVEEGATKASTKRSAKTQTEREVTECASGVVVYELLVDVTRRETL